MWVWCKLDGVKFKCYGEGMTKKIPAKKPKTYHHGDLPSVLLRAAETELSESGIESFSLRSVAKRAGVSHGAPAHHFKDVRGLLTALAATGYERLLQQQINRQNAADKEPQVQSIATGLGYIDFAMQNPALFRLMFSSDMPDRTDADFAKASRAAFDKLVADIQKLNATRTNMEKSGPDVALMVNVVSAWSMVHGLADLIISGRLDLPLGLSHINASQRDEILTGILVRANA